jgi:uncharacterized membrane protein
LYGAVLWLSALAYYLMVRAMLAHHGKDSVLSAALGDGKKERISLALYTVAIPLAFLISWLSTLLYVVVAILWLIPDRRIENQLLK